MHEIFGHVSPALDEPSRTVFTLSRDGWKQFLSTVPTCECSAAAVIVSLVLLEGLCLPSRLRLRGSVSNKMDIHVDSWNLNDVIEKCGTEQIYFTYHSLKCGPYPHEPKDSLTVIWCLASLLHTTRAVCRSLCNGLCSSRMRVSSLRRSFLWILRTGMDP